MKSVLNTLKSKTVIMKIGTYISVNIPYLKKYCNLELLLIIMVKKTPA